jgi:uncharacterized protein (TIGR02246 family)
MDRNIEIINKLVDAYNALDARAFADFFTEDAICYEHPNEIAQNGREDIFAFYKGRFTEFPQNQTEVLHRIVLGNRIIDHERVHRSPDAEPFEAVAIYEMENGLIKRFDIVR